MAGGDQTTMVLFKFDCISMVWSFVEHHNGLNPPGPVPLLGTMACRASLFRPPTLPPTHLHYHGMALLLVQKIEGIRKETPHVSAPTCPHLSVSVPAPSAFSPGTVHKLPKKHLGARPLPPAQGGTRSLLLKDTAAVTFHFFLQCQFLPVPSHFHAHGSMQ